MRKRNLICFLLVLTLMTGICSGAAAALKTGTISNLRATYMGDGNVRLQWDDSSSSGSYRVKYRLDDWQSNYYYYEDTRGKSLIMNYLIPGQTYTIRVENGSSYASGTYTVPYGVYKEYSTGNYLRMTQTKFSVSNLRNHPNYTFDIQVHWPRLKYNRDYCAKLVLKTPFGYTGRCSYWESFTFENQYAYRYVTYAMLSDWLAYVESDFEYIPTGRYQFQFYVNGLLYDVANFTVSN